MATTSTSKGAGACKRTSINIVLIHGNDEFEVGREAKKMVETFCPPANQALGLEVIDGQCDTQDKAVAALRQAQEALQTVGFFGEGKTVWFKNVTFLGTDNLAKNKTVKGWVDQLTAIVKRGMGPDQRLVVSTPKISKATAFYKACAAKGDVREYSLPEKSYQLTRELEERAREAFAERKMRVDQEALTLFMERVGNDTRTLFQEVEKLDLYLGRERKVNAGQVREIVSASEEAVTWDFTDAVGTRQLVDALHIMRQLKTQGQNLLGLVIGLENRFRETLVIKECMEKRWLNVTFSGRWNKVSWNSTAECEQALSTCGYDPRKMHDFRIGKLAQQAQVYSRTEIFQGWQAIVETHEKLVSTSLPDATLVELLVLRLVSRRQ